MSELASGARVGVASTTMLPEAWVQRFLKLPGDRPFTSAEARECGVTYVDLRRFVQAGLLAHPIRGVYVPPALPDNLELRIAILKLVVPQDCVVTDRTAAWLWGAGMILAPGDHLEVPRVSVFCPP
ncbi:MAG TPA: type IV toxin-antitoxin system AbiEi family antitoxin domain-containing protein, partial [Kribbella sp.]|nr:type IV toxin-antitoxin system AbiEi family antitoxin domain-containing protein [Kribbella sp.]